MSSLSDSALRLSTNNTQASDLVEGRFVSAVSSSDGQPNFTSNLYYSSTVAHMDSSLPLSSLSSTVASSTSLSFSPVSSPFGPSSTSIQTLDFSDFIDSPQTGRAHNNLTTNSFFERKGRDHNNDLSTLTSFVDSYTSPHSPTMGSLAHINRVLISLSPSHSEPSLPLDTAQLNLLSTLNSPTRGGIIGSTSTTSSREGEGAKTTPISPLSHLLFDACYPFRTCKVTVASGSAMCNTHEQLWSVCIRNRNASKGIRPDFDASNISHQPIHLHTSLSQRERKKALLDPTLSSSVRFMYHFVDDSQYSDNLASSILPSTKRPKYKDRRSAIREQIYGEVQRTFRPLAQEPVQQSSGPVENITCSVCNVNGNGITEDSGANVWIDHLQTNSIDVLALIDERTKEGNLFDKYSVKRLVRGWHVSKWTVAKGGDHESTNVGGLAILVGPRYSSQVQEYFGDPTGLGVVGALLLSTKPKHILLVATYWTTKPLDDKDEKNSLWERLSRRLKAMGRRGESPIEYIQAECSKYTRLAQSQGWEIIMMGDFNSFYGSRGGTYGDLKKWTAELGLTNLPFYHTQRRNQEINTRWCHGRPTAIDHILTRSEGTRLICSSVIDNKDLPAVFMSDHLPLTVTFNCPMSTATASYIPKLPPMVDLDLRKKDHVASFQSTLLALNIQRPSVTAGTPHDSTPDEPQNNDQTLEAREASTWQCAHFLEEVCRRSVEVLHADAKPRSFDFKPYKGWSPQFILCTYHLSFLYKVRSIIHNAGIKKITTHRKFIEISSAKSRLLSQIATLDRGMKVLNIDSLGAETRPFTDWTEVCNLQHFPSWLTLDISTVRKHMHARRRAEDRALINKFVRANEERRKNKEYRRLLSSIFSRFRKPMDELVLENGELLVDPLKIHDRLNTYMEQWHRRNNQTKNEVDWLRTLEDKDYFMDHDAFSKVPVHLREAISNSLMKHSRNSKLKEDIAASLSEAVTYEDFKKTVDGKASGKAPGISQFSINMLKGLPEDLLFPVYRALNHLWTNRDTGISPESWKNRLLVMVPKLSESAPALDRVRPISLYEVLRKVWTTIITTRIVNVWHDHRVMDKAQCGYTRGKGTHTELLQIINAIEEANELGKEIFLTSYDTSKAFDSVDKQFMVAAWVRLGVPLDVAVYLDSLDTGGRTVIKSPHANSCIWENGFDKAINCEGSSTINTCTSFLAVNGIGQGDSPSATGWLAVYDILLVALRNMEDIKLYVKTSVNQVTTVDPNAYADDLNIISPSLGHAQSSLDTVSAFNYIVGLTTNMGKMECSSNFDNRGQTLLVHDYQWVAHTLAISFKDPIEILGVQIDLQNNWVKQTTEITGKIKRILDQISRKRVTNSSRHLAYTMTFLATAIYPLKFLPLTIKEYENIRRPADNFLKRINGCKIQIPTALLYVDKKYGGLQLPDLVERIQKQKISSLASISSSSSQDQQIGAALLQRVFRQEATTTTKSENEINTITDDTKAWAGSALEDMLRLPSTSLICQNLHHDEEDSSQSPIIEYAIEGKQLACLKELARSDLETISELCKFDQHGERTLCKTRARRRKPSELTQKITALIDETALPQTISGHIKPLRAGGIYLTKRNEIVEFVGVLNNDGRKLIFRQWRVATKNRGRLRAGSLIIPLYEPEELGVTGLSSDDLAAQIYTRRTTTESGSTYKIEDVSYETFKVNIAPYLFTRPRSDPPVDTLVAFTDGAYKRIRDQEDIIFNVINCKPRNERAGAGAVVYVGDRLVQIIETIGIRQARIAGLNAFLTEMIAILSLLITLGDRSMNSTIYSDCESLVKLLKVLSDPKATVQSLAAFPLCPYLNTIQRLSMYRKITFKWVPGHAERLRSVSARDWSLVQIGNHLANSIAVGDCEKVRKQHPTELKYEKILFSAIVKELKKSSTIYVAYNGIPTGVKQLDKLRRERALINYLDKRTIASAEQRGLNWADFTLALSIEVMRKCGMPTSNVTRMKVLYDKYDDDRYKSEEKKRFCPLCKENGSDDLTDHLFNCCPSEEAQRITNLAIGKFDATPLSDITLQHPNAETFKETLKIMLLSQHSCRIGRFNSSHRRTLINIMGSMTVSYTRHLHRDLIKMVGIFTKATFELVELRNSTRAPEKMNRPSIQQKTEVGSVWVQVQSKKRKSKTSDKKAPPVVNTINKVWEAHRLSNNPFNALASQTNNNRTTSGGNGLGAFSTVEEHKVQPGITLVLRQPDTSQLITLQEGDDLDKNISSGNNSACTKYMVVEEQQDYTVRISPSNRQAPIGCVSSLHIPEMAIVIARPSFPPSPISPKRLILSHKLYSRLRWSCYGWREVRGDGNCYYRAIYFSIMERAIGYQQYSSEILAYLHNKFKEVEDILLATYDEQINGYRQLMEDLREQRDMFDSVTSFEDYLIINPRIEIAYVCLMKSIMGRVLMLDMSIPLEQLEAIRQSYGYTDEDTGALWSEKIWLDHIAPLGLEADGPLVQLNSIPTFLGIGCELISISQDGAKVLHNKPINTYINIVILLNTAHYDILYQRRFGIRDKFEDLEEADPVNKYYSHSPVYFKDDSSSQSGDDTEDLTHGYAEPPD